MTTNATPIVALRGVSKAFRAGPATELTILNDIGLQLHAGESVALMGRSGSGKSTLLNLIGLLDTPTTGAVLVDGVDVSTYSERRRAHLRGSHVGFVFQQFLLLERRTAVDNVAEPLLFAPIGALLTRRHRATQLLTSVGLAERLTATSASLSGGEQQRVAIARALARAPRLVCADEPTGALDATTGDAVLSLLFDLVAAHDLALVLATHDPAVAERADRTLRVINGGIEPA